MHKLKIFRVTVAISLFAALALYFIDYMGIIPDSFHLLTRIQWVPAVLIVTPVLSLLFLLSLFMGRFFCSAICPLGILQDVMIRVHARFKKRRKNQFSYHKPYGWIRYGILLLTFISFLTGSSALLLWLDPYSNFGRIITNIFRPLVLLGNNLLARGIQQAGWYGVPVYAQEIVGLTWVSIGAAALMMIVLALFTWKHGRLYCNVICPVGAFLGILSRYSLFRIKINTVECTGCGLCGMTCKAECIDAENHSVDVSRCVSCFNCLKVCRKDAIGYKFVLPSSVKAPRTAYFNQKQSSDSDLPVLESEPEESIKDKAPDYSRREMLGVMGAIAGTLLSENLYGSLPGSVDDKAAHRTPLLPPGAINQHDFTQQCTACHLCITKCPSHVLQPAIGEYGLSGILEPTMKYDKGYCNYNCTLCTEVCPTGALKPLLIAEKRLVKVGEACLRLDLCMVTVQGTDCGACAEHCPTQAVHMVPYRDGLTVPELDPELCIGCGGCEFICPVRPYQAIYVEGLEVQRMARKPEENKEEVKEVEDFGF